MQDYLPTIIGQQPVKNRLQIYGQSYRKTGILPPLLLHARKGAGKTKIIREWNTSLKDPSGNKPPLMKVNCASIKNAESFFQQIFPIWQSGVMLFLDECHNLPDDLEQVFLTALERSENPVRRVTVNLREEGPTDFTIDLRRMSVVMATTDPQKMASPLLDRLTKLTIGSYSNEDLYKIFNLNLKCEVSKHIKQEILFVFRGHPRACVELADELDHFAEAKGKTYINRELFLEFCETMDIHPYGLDSSEMEIIKILGERGQCSLQQLSSATGHSKQVIQQKYEDALLNKGLMDIDGKRILTAKGRELYLSHFVNPNSTAAPDVAREESKTPVEVMQKVQRTIDTMNIQNALYGR